MKNWRITHGKSGTPEYLSWVEMVRRCEDPRRPEYPRYGGRGIFVCRRWRESFECFLEDMGPKPDRSYSLDRIDNGGNYEPSNCRWADNKTQNRNRRNARFVLFRGKKERLPDLAERYGIDVDTARSRIRNGWDVEAAITHPVKRQKNNSPNNTHTTSYGKHHKPSRKRKTCDC